MRIFATGLTLLTFILAPSEAYACTAAPNYLENEFGNDGVVLRPIASDAHKAIIGRFIPTDHPRTIRFKVQTVLKGEQKYETLNVNFRDVGMYHVYFYPDKDNVNGHKNIAEVRSVILSFQNRDALGNSPQTNEAISGWGGIISEIHYGSNCERSVMLYQDQDYLLFLDKNQTVQGSFAIESTSIPSNFDLEDYFSLSGRIE